MGGPYQQEIDLASALKDVCSDYVQTCTVPQQLPNLIDRAIRIALTARAPTALIFPSDVFDLGYEAPDHAFEQVPSSMGLAPSVATPDPTAIRQAVDLPNDGEKVAVLSGQGARGAAAEVIEVAELLGAGVAKALLGKDVLSDELPWVTGSIGLLGTTASWELMQGCHTLLTVGSNMPYSQFLPEFGRARAVQIGRSGGWLGMRYPYELTIEGDATATLRALIPLLERKDKHSWRETVEKSVADWRRTAERQAMTDATSINAMRLFHELSLRLPTNAIVTADPGSVVNWYARYLKFRGEVRGSLSGTLATIGAAVPYAIGAKWAHPDRPAIAFEGDGAVQKVQQYLPERRD